jgi:hypothetical protein
LKPELARGCFDPASGTDGNGNMCPRLLSNLVAAINRANAADGRAHRRSAL